MKPMRGTPSLSRERRTAIYTMFLLLFMLAGLIGYQRWVLGPAKPVPAPNAPLSTEAPGANKVDELASQTPPTGTDAVPAAAPAAPSQLNHPVAADRTVKLGYEVVYSQRYADYRMHPGLDFDARAGEDVKAAERGTVVDVDRDPADGLYVEIDHGGGLMTRYANLGTAKVAKNAAVAANAVIGTIAHGTADTNPHLHFEVKLHGEPVDPSTYLNR